MLPQEWGYNSGNYFVNLTFLPFMEVAYRCTLLKVESTGKWNQDRSVSLRLRPLKEGKWWPSVVIGSNDLLTTGELNPFLDSGGNRYFSSVYAVGTKHFGFYGHDICLPNDAGEWNTRTSHWNACTNITTKSRMMK